MPVSLQPGRSIARLAPVALMPAGTFAVHELRYLLAYGPRASLVLQRQGHAYMHSLVPWLVLSLGLVLGGFARCVGRAWAGERSLPRYSLSLVALWLLCTVSLLALYAGQESLEGLLASGHPVGWAGVFGYGGWWAIPAALCVGLVLAAAYHGARWMLHTVASCGRRRPAIAAGAAVLRVVASVARPRLAPVADGWSGRGPPR
jgi:hypothetical protein